MITAGASGDGRPGGGAGSSLSPAVAGGARERVVSVANWPGYIDVDPADPTHWPSLAEFTRRTGIKVDYSEPIHSDQQFFGMIGLPLAMGEYTGYDLVVLSDWMAAQLVGLGWAEAIRPESVPNAANLLPELRASPVAGIFDHCLPWQAGFTGIGCNLPACGRPVAGIRDLLTAPDLRGRVSLVADMRDVMGLLLLERGSDPGSFTAVEFDLAIAELEQAVAAGQIRTVTNSYQAGLGRGDIAACVAWAGDVLTEQRRNPDVQFVVPEAGGMLWTDNMVIPAHSLHRREAEEFINYYYEPDVAAQVAASQLFICPVTGAREAMRRAGRQVPHEEFVSPTRELLARGYYFARLTPVQNAVYTEKFASAVGL